MAKVFISYSHRDRFFAELLERTLEGANIEVWRDTGALLAGTEWRPGIDNGIAESFSVVLVLSPWSSESHFVTYEWASAMGQGKPIVPLLIEDCKIHPKIEPIQYIDFRHHNKETWTMFANRLKTIRDDAEPAQQQDDTSGAGQVVSPTAPQIEARDAIKAYLLERGFRMISFDRIRQKIDSNYTDEFLLELQKITPEFKVAYLKGPKRGIGLR